MFADVTFKNVHLNEIAPIAVRWIYVGLIALLVVVALLGGSVTQTPAPALHAQVTQEVSFEIACSPFAALTDCVTVHASPSVVALPGFPPVH